MLAATFPAITCRFLVYRTCWSRPVLSLIYWRYRLLNLSWIEIKIHQTLTLYWRVILRYFSILDKILERMPTSDAELMPHKTVKQLNCESAIDGIFNFSHFLSSISAYVTKSTETHFVILRQINHKKRSLLTVVSQKLGRNCCYMCFLKM